MSNPLTATLTENASPFGAEHLEVDAAQRYRIRSDNALLTANTIRCCIRGCESWLSRFHRGAVEGASTCPLHGIRTSPSPTYVYGNRWRNFIIRIDSAQLVVVAKVESWRLGNENSEDAVSWNVFVSLAELGALRSLFQLLTGIEAAAEPELYVWGNGLYGATHLAARLKEIRSCLETGVPIQTEPDVMMRVPGQAVVLIEAKLGSSNSSLKGKSVGEFLERYRPAAGCIDPIARKALAQREPHEVLGQLCRNVMFAQHLGEPGERALVVNLVREDSEIDIQQRFGRHLASDSPVQFRRVTWEDIYRLPIISSDKAVPLRKYLQNKTVSLRRAFNT